MRSVIYAINLTLDGCCDHTKFNPPDDDELLAYSTQLLRDADLLVFGRKTYQLMVPYWPDIAKSQSETEADIENVGAYAVQMAVDAGIQVVGIAHLADENLLRSLDVLEGRPAEIMFTGNCLEQFAASPNAKVNVLANVSTVPWPKMLICPSGKSCRS